LKFKGNELVTGIMWGVVLHAVINVVLPQLKTLNISQLLNFNVQATTPPATTPPATTPPTDEEPADGEEEEPADGEEEEEPMDGEEEEDYGENAEEYDEDSPEGQATSERVNEMSGAGVAYGSRGGGGRRRNRNVGEDNITAEYAMRVRVY